jgi:hypothetical protein
MMISRALLRLLPFLCLLVLESSAKTHDHSTRRLSSPGYYGKKELNRKLKGMNNNKVDSSDSHSSMQNDWRRFEADPGVTNSHNPFLRFLKKAKSSSTKQPKTKTKKDSTRTTPTDDGIDDDGTDDDGLIE